MPASNQILEENQIQAVLKAGEILAARIRYNRALFTYIQNASDLELLAYMQETNGANYLPNLAALGMSAEQARSDSLSKIIGDIRMLIALNKLLQECVIDKTKILGFVQKLRINIATDANAIKHNKAELNRLKGLSVNGGNAFNKHSIAAAKAEYLKHAKEKLEMYALEEIQNLLIDNKVIGSFEQRFYDEFVTIKVVHGEGETKYEIYQNIDMFIKLLKTNMSLYNSALSQFDRTCKSGVTKGLNIDVVAQILQENFLPLGKEVAEHSHVSLQTDMTADSQLMREGYEVSCRFQFGFGGLVAEAASKITQIFSTEKQFLLEQKAIAAELAKAAQLEARKLSGLEKQQREEAQQRLVQQQLEQEERDKQQRILRKQQNIEARRVKEALKEQENAEKAEKKRLRIQEIIAASTIKFDSNSMITASRFTIAPDVITANYLDLCGLFDPATKEFRYRKVESFVGALGGRLETATGSSHIRIIFRGSIYQEVDFCGAEKSVTKVAGIARPHAGETVLRHHNLELFRGAIISVLPKDWENRYRPQISSQKLKH